MQLIAKFSSTHEKFDICPKPWGGGYSLYSDDRDDRRIF